MCNSSNNQTIVIISDSRGTGLEDCIKQHPSFSDYNHVIRILPGKDLTQIGAAAKQITSNLRSRFYCVILAGICSLTERSTVLNERRLHYPLQKREDKISKIIDTIKDLKSQPGGSYNICFFVPASLHKYFKHYNPTAEPPAVLDEEQSALLDDINQINEVIDDLNTSTTNINLLKRVQVNVKKRKQKTNNLAYRKIRKFSDKELVDGVHFSDTLKNICFPLIYDTAIRDIREETFLQDSQDSQDSDNDWDFKRCHQTHS